MSAAHGRVAGSLAGSLTGRSTAVGLLALVAIAPAIAGCDAIEPEVGPPVRERCQNVDSDPETDVSYARDVVGGIFAVVGDDDPTACANCHAPDGPTPIGIEVGGLDMSTYDGLRAGGAVSGGDIIIPGQPCDSTLIHKVSAGPPFGSRMPLSGPPFLSPEELGLLHDWIAEGARDN